MSETTQEKDNFILYVALLAAVLVGGLLALKLNENEKFTPIQNQLDEEVRLLNIRVLN